MRQPVLILILFFTLSSWKIDKQGPWKVTKEQRVTLYTRPIQYSMSDSPDSLTIQEILIEQEHVIDYINKRLNTDFQSNVKIYLYNLDEAKEKIGTKGGGACQINQIQKTHILHLL